MFAIVSNLRNKKNYFLSKVTFQTPKLETSWNPLETFLTVGTQKKPFIYVCYNSHEKKFADMIYVFQYTTL